jgi:uncharacterized protein YdbL (DUF1318 family)
MKIKWALILSFCLCVSLYADDLADRMTKRRPQIEQLKKEGVLGENNKGYLEFVGDVVKNKALVEAQNKDRKEGYSIVAKKQGVSVEQVAKVRAAYYAKKTKSGEYFQSRSGKWVKK